MIIDKAIKILTINNDHNPDFTDADRRDAHQLGIEALKRCKEARTKVYFTTRTLVLASLLPGETIE